MKRVRTRNNRINIFRADCLEVMKKIKSNSIDSIVTDPPYALIDPRLHKRKLDRFLNTFSNVEFPNLYNLDLQLRQFCQLCSKPRACPLLAGIDRPIRKFPRVRVPKRSINLKHNKRGE